MWLQNIRFGPSNVITSESNSSNDENNRYDTDSERGATTVLKLKRHSTLESYHVNNTGNDVRADVQTFVDNLSIQDEQPLEGTDSERESDSDEHSMGEDADGNHDNQTYQFSQLTPGERQLVVESRRLQQEAQYSDNYYQQNSPHNGNFYQNDRFQPSPFNHGNYVTEEGLFDHNMAQRMQPSTLNVPAGATKCSCGSN